MRVILVGGSSHAGKSTLARRLAERPGWTAASTDGLARHPGRPWPLGERPVPPHVAEHYLSLPPEALLASVLAHYDAMWPLAEALVRRHAEDDTAARLVLEGSALLPARVAELSLPSVKAIWLTGDDALFEDRIRATSRYDTADATGRAMIEAFLARTRLFDRFVRDEVERLGLASMAAGDADSPDALADLCLARL